MQSRFFRLNWGVLLLFIAVNVQGSYAQRQSFHAGIEVGSKGVKLCILNNALAVESISKKVVYDTTINTDFIKFSESTHKATLSALLSLYNIAYHSFKVNPNDIFLAISSGVQQTAERDKKVNFIKDFIWDVKSNLEDPQREVEVVSVYQESIFTHKSIIPKEENMTTIIIDIGSGNTKGGYFISSNVFNVFNIPWGTKSTTNAVEKICDTPCSISDFSSHLQKKLNAISDQDIPAAVDKCGITNYDFKILFSGGIVWATATLARPELIKEQTIDLSLSEVEKFHNQLIRNFDKITGGEYNQQFIDEKYRVQKVFNQNSLIGGSGLLIRIMKKFERVSGTRKYGLIRNNRAGWLPGYIVDKIEVREGRPTISFPK